MTAADRDMLVLRWLVAQPEGRWFTPDHVAAEVHLDTDAAIFALDALRACGDLTFHRSTPDRRAGWAASAQARARKLPEPEPTPAPGYWGTYVSELDERACPNQGNVHALLDALIRRQGNSR